jgi:dUTP pyrophosphatase
LCTPITIYPGEERLISSGVRGHWPPFLAPVLLPRSGNGRNGLILGNTVGLIDQGYEGELMAAVWYRKDPGDAEPWQINPGDKIFQVVFALMGRPVMQLHDSLPCQSLRGAGGFGSTGAT